MERLGYYNGEYGPLEEMKIPMLDRVCYFGDGVYDAGPAHDYHIFALDQHVDRFYRNAGLIGIDMPMPKDEFKALLNKLIRELDTGDLLAYYQVTRATAPRNHVFPTGVPANLWITFVPSVINDGTTPIQLITTEDKRFEYCYIKTLNLLPSVMASEEARQAGCQEAVFYRPGGRVTECAHSNIHILKDGVLHTAPTDELILPGIARSHLLQACDALQIPVVQEPFFLPDLFAADEVLVTSSSCMCLHADVIDGKPVGGRDGERLEKLRSYLVEEFYRETSA